MIRDLGIVDVDDSAVVRILALEESHFLDLKAIDIDAGKLGTHAAAFANAAGGELYVGVDETDRGREWRGFGAIEDANSHIQVLHNLFQGSDLVSAQFVRGAGVSGFVLHLVVEKSGEIIESSNGDVYIRVSAQRQPVKLNSHKELERLKLDKGISSYEDMRLTGVALDVVADSLTVTGFVIEAVPVSEAEPWLRSQMLIVQNAPTVAAVLLFADQPQVVLPKHSAIKIIRYKSSDIEGRRDQMDGTPSTIEGPLVQQIEEAVAKVTEIVESQRVQTESGLQSITYPPETLHEIVTNAVLHRDYSIITDVQIRIFDNRIEVDSPGRLPGHVTEENLLDSQFARNGKIVRLANKFPNPPNKDIGEGLNTAYEKMRDIGLKPPQILEVDGNVVAYIRHEKLASYEEQILEFLVQNGEINNSKARMLTGEGSENKMKRTFERMMNAGQIHRDPTRKGSATTYKVGPPLS